MFAIKKKKDTTFYILVKCDHDENGDLKNEQYLYVMCYYDWHPKDFRK